MNGTTNPPALRFWQAPASAQKTQKGSQAGNSPERAVARRWRYSPGAMSARAARPGDRTRQDRRPEAAAAGLARCPCGGASAGELAQ